MPQRAHPAKLQVNSHVSSSEAVHGLSSFVDAGPIRDVLARTADLDQAVADLVGLAYEAGAPNNVTVIAAELPDGEWHERPGSPLILGSAADVAALP